MISNKNKRRLIQGIFLTPFFTCLITVISIRSYIFNRMAIACPDGSAQNLLLFIAFVLLINAVASFISLVAYYCLDNRVGSLLITKTKKLSSRRGKINYSMLEEDFINYIQSHYNIKLSLESLHLPPAAFGLDSLDAVEMVLWAEEKYDIKIGPENKLETKPMLEFLGVVYSEISKKQKKGKSK